MSKHSSIKDGEIAARASSTPCPTPEFRMSVLLARDENTASQKDLHGRSPGMRAKSSGHQRDKSNLRSRDTLRLVNEKQPNSLYEVMHRFQSTDTCRCACGTCAGHFFTVIFLCYLGCYVII